MSSYYDTSSGQARIIPGAGTYLQDQAKSQSAYERAKAQLMSQRSQKQISSGLNKEYQADPNAQYGTYQQMLQSQGQDLNQAQEVAQQRGFFGPGLGNQGESALRYGHAVQNLGFKNSLADYENMYQTGMGDLERQKQESMLAALQGAADYGVTNEDYTPYDPGPSEPDYPTNPPGSNAPPTSKPVKKYPTSKPGSRPSGNPMHRPRPKPKPVAKRGGGSVRRVY